MFESGAGLPTNHLEFSFWVLGFCMLLFNPVSSIVDEESFYLFLTFLVEPFL